MSSVKAMRLCTGRGQFHRKFNENQLLFFLLKPLQIHPQLSNKQVLLNPGFSLLKQMHISLSVPQAHKGLIPPETPKWPEGLSVHVQTQQKGQREGPESLISLGSWPCWKQKHFMPC